MVSRTFDLHIVIWPGDDESGEWIAHCLEFGLVSQGNSLPQAISMIREAVEMILVDDLSKGFEPERRRAPKDDWDSMWQRLRAARPMNLDEATSGDPAYVVLESSIRVTRMSSDEIDQVAAGTLAPPPPVEYSVPVAFRPSAA